MILLLMPMAQILLFGFALSAEIKNIDIALLDMSQDEVTRRIIQRFDGNKYFNAAKKLNSIKDLDTAFEDGKISMVMVFQNNFAENLVKNGRADMSLLIDASDPNKGSMISIYALNVMASVNEEIAKTLMPQGSGALRILPTIKMLYNPQGKSAYNFVPGLMGMVLMMICAMMTSISIVREKEKGSMELLLTSPVKPIVIIIAKATPYFVISCASLTGILLISVYALDMKIAGSLFIVVAFCMVYIIMALSLGILISSLAKTQVSAMLVSGMMFMMPIMLLSGMIFPIESMPKILQWLSDIIPAKWFIIGIKKVMLEGLDFSSIKKEFFVLLLITLLAILASLKKFKNRLD